MSHRALNWTITALITALFALVMSGSHLLDGPSELDAMQDTALAKQDAINSAATHAAPTRASGQIDHKTALAEAAQ